MNGSVRFTRALFPVILAACVGQSPTFGGDEVGDWIEYTTDRGLHCNVVTDGHGNVYIPRNTYPPPQLHMTKRDSAGETIWSTTIDGAGTPYRARLSSSGGIVMAGGAGKGFPTKVPGGPVVPAEVHGAFVLELDVDGNLVWSSIWPGLDYGDLPWDGTYRMLGLVVASDGVVYLCGSVFQSIVDLDYDVEFHGGQYDGFVAKIRPTGQMEWLRLLGGSGDDQCCDLDYHPDHGLFVVGDTDSVDFEHAGEEELIPRHTDAFVAGLSPSGEPVWVRVFGSSYEDTACSVGISASGSFWVAGGTNRSDFPLKSAHKSTYGGGLDGFLVRFLPSGEMAWSTYIGGATFRGGSKDEDENSDIGLRLLVKDDDAVLVGGSTSSAELVTTPPLDTTHNGYIDCFVAEYDGQGALRWCTYVGGNRTDRLAGLSMDGEGCLYVSGNTDSEYFLSHVAPGPRGTSWTSGFVLKFCPNDAPVPTPQPTDTPGSDGQGDINGDGHVDSEDLLLLMDRWHE